MPADSKKLGINFKSLRKPIVSEGIGGLSKGFNETAVLAFSDGRYIYGFDIELEIPKPTGKNQHFPSLLGRDVLNRCRLVADFKKRLLICTPRTWDLRIKL